MLRRALNRNQKLILAELTRSRNDSATQILTRLSKKHTIPLSTLKMNARILRELGLIDFGSSARFRTVALTELGRNVLSLISQNRPDKIAMKKLVLGKKSGTRKKRGDGT